MPAVLICPRPNCHTENTGRACSRCGWDLGEIACPRCETPTPEARLTEISKCEECGSQLTPFFVLEAPCDIPETTVDTLLAHGRFRIHKSLGRRQFIVTDCRPLCKRLTTPINEASPAAAYQRFAPLAAVPTLIDVVSDAATGDFVLLGGLVGPQGNVFPTITQMWPGASTQRRLAWLVAWVRLAGVLAADGWSQSVVEANNLIVNTEGQLVIRGMLPDSLIGSPAPALGRCWLEVLGVSRPIWAPKPSAIELLARRLAAGESGLVDAQREVMALQGTSLVELRHYGTTDMGRKRDNNEDGFLGWQGGTVEIGSNGTATAIRGLFAVCDGMGGHARGEVAARTAIATLRKLVVPILLDEDPGQGNLPERLGSLIKNDVNSAILARNGEEHEVPGLRRMGTTLVMVVVVDDQACWAHVGDSRIYKITRSNIEQLTEDHNIGTRDVNMGVATMLEAFRSPVGKHLTQALGPKGSEFVHPDTGLIDVAEPTVLLLCSDGLSDMVPEDDLYQTLLRHWDELDIALSDLVNRANEGGGLDNITAMLVRIEPKGRVFPLVTNSPPG